eukprot:TRINITY_DN68004_c1_g3_i4.p1 TRINITY_DN68004_c1_g3~~TRINITY_DN68004_c1_g3_i4.p1  ORF type:complete len:603 (-),score=60.84 TRINITY_DN68004_c1_g3_i4:1079-2836(-)
MEPTETENNMSGQGDNHKQNAGNTNAKEPTTPGTDSGQAQERDEERDEEVSQLIVFKTEVDKVLQDLVNNQSVVLSINKVAAGRMQNRPNYEQEIHEMIQKDKWDALIAGGGMQDTEIAATVRFDVTTAFYHLFPQFAAGNKGTVDMRAKRQKIDTEVFEKELNSDPNFVPWSVIKQFKQSHRFIQESDGVWVMQRDCFQKIFEQLDSSDHVVLYGPKGVGKSHCLMAYWRTLAAQTKPVIYFPSTAVTAVEEVKTVLRRAFHAHPTVLSQVSEIGSQADLCNFFYELNLQSGCVVIIDQFNALHRQGTHFAAVFETILKNENLKVVVGLSMTAGTEHRTQELLMGYNRVRWHQHSFSQMERAEYFQHWTDIATPSHIPDTLLPWFSAEYVRFMSNKGTAQTTFNEQSLKKSFEAYLIFLITTDLTNKLSETSVPQPLQHMLDSVRRAIPYTGTVDVNLNWFKTEKDSEGRAYLSAHSPCVHAAVCNLMENGYAPPKQDDFIQKVIAGQWGGPIIQGEAVEQEVIASVKAAALSGLTISTWEHSEYTWVLNKTSPTHRQTNLFNTDKFKCVQMHNQSVLLLFVQL